jgi:hypothetical protein
MLGSNPDALALYMALRQPQWLSPSEEAAMRAMLLEKFSAWCREHPEAEALLAHSRN